MKSLVPATLLSLMVAACNGGAGGVTASAAPANKAVFEFFVMSKCPFGVQVEDAFGPVKEKLGDAVELKINYIGDGGVDALTSMHGPSEVTGDIAQLCAMAQDPNKAFDMILCQNKDMKSVDTNWTDCGTSTGLDVAALTSCVQGDEGKKLLAASFEAAKARGAKGSPTIFLDGKPYQGGRKTRDFLQASCDFFGANAPQACKDIPKPVAINAIFFSDERCGADCDLHKIEPKLKSAFAGLQVKYVDYSSDEGKALYTELQAAEPTFKHLPEILFVDDPKQDADAYADVQRYLKPLGKYQELRLGGSFDPKAEICDNKADDDANGQADCADATCKEQMVCRETKPKKLDLFVMSHCPYGAKALIATNDALQVFGDEMDLTIHFIGSGEGAELSSMHGPKEVEEDLHEICVQAHYPKPAQFMKYMACISKDYAAVDWKVCAKEAGVDTKVVETCSAGAEGKKLLGASFALASSLNITGSPTFLSNNKRTFNAIAAPDVQKQFCQDNAGLKGCDGIVQVDASAAKPVDPAQCGAPQ